MSNVSEATLPIGSLAGSGAVLLAGHTLGVGSNNLDTTFSGVLEGSGGIIKNGSGTFALRGNNTYTGSTIVSAGVLLADNNSGSATGASVVEVQAGTLGGKGRISGAVTIGSGSGSGAFLAPSVGSNRPATLSLKKTLTFKADGTYTCKLNTRSGRADQVLAQGVTIEGGAQFSFQVVGNKGMIAGTVFTVIDSTADSTLGGAFSNLPDGSTFTSGRNNYQVSYKGGDGNDLTLTVVP